jgi:hypothetical protein
VVSIPACHAGDPGSIPGLGVNFFDLWSNEQPDKAIPHVQHAQAMPQNPTARTSLHLTVHAHSTEMARTCTTDSLQKIVEVLPGLEPGLQGSKPWVLTNYTIETG